MTDEARAVGTGDRMADAIRAWQAAIGPDRVLDEPGKFGIDTSLWANPVHAVLRPATIDHVQAIVRIAGEFRVPLYPFSTGQNWGYGTNVPITATSVVVDLSAMSRIVDCDTDLGVVTVEPGVTQGALRAYLDEHDLPFMVPVTGAGPTCSIMSNALERGFGLTPVCDHWAAVRSLTAVLPSGELYRSPLREHNGLGAANAHAWGVGPYLDGVFAQSSFGIVVEMGIALAPRPERTGAFVFSLRGDDDLDAAAAALKDVLNRAGSCVAGINLLSDARLAVIEAGSRRVHSARGLDAPDGEGVRGPRPKRWVGLGSIYTSREHYWATRRLVRRALRGRATRVMFFSERRLRRLGWIARQLKRLHIVDLVRPLDQLSSALDLIHGRPSEVALNLAYAKSGTPRDGQPLNPALDGCGLFWYAPIVPNRGDTLSAFVAFAEETCGEAGLPAPLAFTTVSPQYLICTLPILFDRADSDAEARARACLEQLVRRGRERGFVPYRLSSHDMGEVVDAELPHWRTVAALKAALDPDMILAPGRYGG